MSQAEPTPPTAENGVLYLGPMSDMVAALLQSRWPWAKVGPLPGTPATRIDLSGAPGGRRPGVADAEGLALLSMLPPGAPAVGWFCDASAGAEGVRIFVEGGEERGLQIDWRRPQVPDPLAWPIGQLSLDLRVPVEAITRVRRPGRPPLAVAIEALLHQEEVAEAELRHEALQLMGQLPHPEATKALARALRSSDWVDRFHAARAYASKVRGQGTGELPDLASLMGDADESVRQAALEGICELVAEVEFADLALQKQIDAAIARGNADADEDVRAAAEAALARRRELLG